MVWLRMLRVAARLAWPHLLQPWRSPLVRWRMETFGVVDAQGRLLSASAIDRRTFCRFIAAHRGRLLRFLRWAAGLSRG
jgi:hypothetical protein